MVVSCAVPLPIDAGYALEGLMRVMVRVVVEHSEEEHSLQELVRKAV